MYVSQRHMSHLQLYRVHLIERWPEVQILILVNMFFQDCLGRWCSCLSGHRSSVVLSVRFLWCPSLLLVCPRGISPNIRMLTYDLWLWCLLSSTILWFQVEDFKLKPLMFSFSSLLTERRWWKTSLYRESPDNDRDFRVEVSVSSVTVELDNRLPSTVGRTDETTKERGLRMWWVSVWSRSYRFSINV